jgi:hypothetical protein
MFLRTVIAILSLFPFWNSLQKMVLPTFLVAAVRHHFELAAVEPDSQAIVCEVSKSSGCRFDGLNSAVETIGDYIGYAMPEVAQESTKMVLEHSSYLLVAVPAMVQPSLQSGQTNNPPLSESRITTCLPGKSRATSSTCQEESRPSKTR